MEHERNHTGIACRRVEEGDEVIVPSHTFVSIGVPDQVAGSDYRASGV